MNARSVAAILLLSACGGSTPVDSGKPTVRISASDVAADRLAPALATAYEAQRDVDVVVFQSDGSVYEPLLSGEADIAAATMRPTPAERDQARINGYTLEGEGRHLVAVNVVAVTIHPSNPLESLTYDQVIGIFCTGSVDSWAFLGQDDRPIHALVRPANSGTRAVFEDFFCGPKGLSGHVEELSPAEIEAKLTTDPDAISFESLSEGFGKVIGLRSDALGHAILPSQQNVIRGAYPLYHDVLMYTNGAPSDETRAFMDWIATPSGQDIVDEQRFVPLYLRPARMDEPRPLRETIHFETGNNAPTQRSEARLRLLVDELRERSGQTNHIVLEGYTDADEGDGIALSQARAESVKSLLERELPGTFFEIIPRGAENPIAPNSTPYGRQQNRRVQIYLADEEKEGAPATPEPPGP